MLARLRDELADLDNNVEQMWIQLEVPHKTRQVGLRVEDLDAELNDD